MEYSICWHIIFYRIHFVKSFFYQFFFPSRVQYHLISFGCIQNTLIAYTDSFFQHFSPLCAFYLASFSFHFYFLTSSLRASYLIHCVFLYYLTIPQVLTFLLPQLEFHQEFLLQGKPTGSNQLLLVYEASVKMHSSHPLIRPKIKIRQMASAFARLLCASVFGPFPYE